MEISKTIQNVKLFINLNRYMINLNTSKICHKNKQNKTT